MMKSILITGGAGFIGVNAAQYFGEKGWQVTLIDNLYRPSAPFNLKWLQGQVPIQFEKIDIRDNKAVERIVKATCPDVLLHLAAQVAVTTSVNNPREDFEINALGTLNLLEALRKFSPDSFFINASTNKVYGKMADIGICEKRGRYEYATLAYGVDETAALDFHSPYGCSKGAADQYTIDYARIYGLRTTTIRQSCIYGPHQFGIEDQGWVAWFTIAAVLEKPITVYGDGKQVRDVLHVKDLCRAYEAVLINQTFSAGQAFNVGGGPGNTLSLLELLDFLETRLAKKIVITRTDWRPGDQPVFVCNLNKARKILRWEPEISVQSGISTLLRWVMENKSLISNIIVR
jgi:CDP-paratose 2-epimerase